MKPKDGLVWKCVVRFSFIRSDPIATCDLAYSKNKKGK
jgi:hypothetical protein